MKKYLLLFLFILSFSSCVNISNNKEGYVIQEILNYNNKFQCRYLMHQYNGNPYDFWFYDYPGKFKIGDTVWVVKKVIVNE